MIGKTKDLIFKKNDLKGGQMINWKKNKLKNKAQKNRYFLGQIN